ncbi:MAG: FAD-dependent oxidoreductase [Candidatus Omnitrophica bacterium]|nr:FAD-dependent oxidoreductase [Candidatus Omnitrophota bacterium]MBU1869119.1 FAD-dependent oxidoreductase [Candidatus Omnitrophota bacterium]
MNKLIIIGGGFAGLSALNRLKGHPKDLELVLIDKGEKFDFLPLLPDAIGREIIVDHLTNDLAGFCKSKGVRFINEVVTEIDFGKQEVFMGARVLNYDYLIIASGSETNFYSNEALKKQAYKIDDAGDTELIRSAIKDGHYDTYMISGGGYTGIEVATNLRVFLNKEGRKGRIVIVERAPSILGPLPQWMKDYVFENLKELQVECFTGVVIEKVEGNKVFLQGGKVFENAMLIWTAGVKTSDFIQRVQAEKNPQGRIKVDEYLRLNEHCFVVGDAAYVAYGDTFLRMAVQFAIMQGETAAENVLNSIRGGHLKKYRPIDLGYIIPMANNRSCGVILGGNIKGFPGILLHYLMCVYRSCTLRNKWGLIKDLLKA